MSPSISFSAMPTVFICLFFFNLIYLFFPVYMQCFLGFPSQANCNCCSAVRLVSKLKCEVLNVIFCSIDNVEDVSRKHDTACFRDTPPHINMWFACCYRKMYCTCPEVFLSVSDNSELRTLCCFLFLFCFFFTSQLDSFSAKDRMDKNHMTSKQNVLQYKTF